MSSTSPSVTIASCFSLSVLAEAISITPRTKSRSWGSSVPYPKQYPIAWIVCRQYAIRALTLISAASGLPPPGRRAPEHGPAARVEGELRRQLIAELQIALADLADIGDPGLSGDPFLVHRDHRRGIGVANRLRDRLRRKHVLRQLHQRTGAPVEHRRDITGRLRLPAGDLLHEPQLAPGQVSLRHGVIFPNRRIPTDGAARSPRAACWRCVSLTLPFVCARCQSAPPANPRGRPRTGFRS